MAKVTKVYIQYGRKVQVKQYEPIDATLGTEIELDETDEDSDPLDIIKKAYLALRHQVHELLIIDFEAHGVKIRPDLDIEDKP